MKDLIRKPDEVRPPAEDSDEAAMAFISAAPLSATPVPKRKRKKAPTFVRTTFSLSKDLNKQIDKISLMPRAFRISRSDVIRASIMALQNLEKSDLIALLESASKTEPIKDLEDEE